MKKKSFPFTSCGVTVEELSQLDDPRLPQWQMVRFTMKGWPGEHALAIAPRQGDQQLARYQALRGGELPVRARQKAMDVIIRTLFPDGGGRGQ